MEGQRCNLTEFGASFKSRYFENDGSQLIPVDVLFYYIQESERKSESILNGIQNIRSKVDQLVDQIQYIRKNVKSLAKPVDENSSSTLHEANTAAFNSVKKDIMKLKDLRKKYVRSEKLSTYYEELCKRKTPYVPRKFRVKVNETTHQDEIPHEENEAIHKVTMEIKLMKIRLVRWKKNIDILNRNISNALESNRLTSMQKEDFINEMALNDERSTKKSDEAFQKIKLECETEYVSGNTQFLLKFVKHPTETDTRRKKRW